MLFLPWADRGQWISQHTKLPFVLAKDGGDFVVPWALHIHEVGVGVLHQVVLLFSPLLERDEACCCGEVFTTRKPILFFD